MMVLVTYDVAIVSDGGARRLRKIARICENYGQRVQNSVFECDVDPALWATIRNSLIKAMDQNEDSLRFYFLGREWRRRVEHIGAKPTEDPDGLLVI